MTERRDDVLYLTLNRPDQYNALSEDMLGALQSAFDGCAEDAALRAVVIAGAGKAFCAGHDLKQMRSHDGDRAYYQQLFERCGRVMRSEEHTSELQSLMRIS